MNIKTLVIGSVLTVTTLGAFAQAASAPNTPRVDQRETHQDQRIQQGVASGELNAKETYRLEKQQGAVQTAEAKAKADGKVTKKERKHLHNMQDRTSQNIHQQKHDAQATKP